MWRLAASAILLAASGVLAADQDTTPQVGDPAPGRRWPVGATERRFTPEATYNWRGAKTKELFALIWYPAEGSTAVSEQFIGPPASPLFRLGSWADRAKPAAGRFPLIVLSHGTGGSAQIMAWLASGLAARGSIVAAVNHPGNNALEPYTAEGFLLWWERAKDVSATLDMLLADPDLRDRIDRSRIGAAGFSLGGYTALVLAGARTDLVQLDKFCRSPEAEGCSDPPEFPNLMARREELKSNPAFRKATEAAGSSYRDARIGAAFAIAPALVQAFVIGSLKEIDIPVAVVAGGDDRLVPVNTNARAIALSVPRAQLTVLPDGVGHYTFLATCTDAGLRQRPDLCVDAPRVDRNRVHGRVVDLAVAFFQANLR